MTTNQPTPERECRLAVSGTIDRDDRCKVCLHGMYFRVDENKKPLTMFCGNMDCYQGFKEVAL